MYSSYCYLSFVEAIRIGALFEEPTEALVFAILMGGIVFAVLRMTANREESYLRATCGGAYDDYTVRMSRVLPNSALFGMASTARVNAANLRTNFFDAVVFVALISDAESIVSIREVAGLFKLWVY